ncbi:hypothetical protein DFH28DRAFT_316528 [Melampsora americana]|nr:hypothetical protein DFH28DRAFT_316528 [Melampsora americana]
MSTISPDSKRNKLESPIIHQNSLALPGTSWKSNPSNQSSQSQMNSKFNQSNHSNHHQTELTSPPDDRPMASGSGTSANLTNQSTDFHTINDAVGISGVDIAAEEELARQQTSMYGSRALNRSNSLHSHSLQSYQPLWNSTNRDRVKITDFLNKQQLTSMVQQIAASYQLKTLEPAILDVLTQAAEQRLHSIIIDSISAKDHRIASSHLRPPPLYPTPSTAPVLKGKQKEKAREAMYDQVIYDEPERILSILARVEGEEERKSRIERESDPNYEGLKSVGTSDLTFEFE